VVAPLRVLLIAAVLAGTVAPAAGPAVAAPPTTYANPVVSGLTANPFVLRAGSTYYAYVSGFDFFLPFPVMALSSTDLVTWTQVGNVLATASAGAWADASSGWLFSSPSVRFVPGNAASSRYVLYFTGTEKRTGRRCVGVATSGSPAGPFTGAAAPLICPDGGAQDASPLPLPLDAPIQEIVYRRNGSGAGIYNQVLTADGQSVHPGLTAPYLLYTADPGWWQQGVVDRPAVTISPSGQVILLFSGGPAGTGGRAVGWTTCTAGFGVVTTCSSRNPAARLIAPGDRVASPEGAQVFDDGTSQWIAYDGLPGGSCAGAACTGVRGMRIDRLCFDGGAPRTNAPTTGAQPLARSASCAADVPARWVASWASGVGPARSNWPDFGGAFADGFEQQTLRQVVHASIGGSAVRIKISNLFGATPLQVGAATVAVSTEAAGATAALQGTPRSLTFGGAASTLVPAGQAVASDEVTLAVPGDHDLAVSLYLPGPTGAPSGHLWAAETSHVGPGNLVGDGGGSFTATTTASYYVTAVDVLGDAPLGAVVALGDSLTDGILAVAPDAERRWPDVVLDRLLAAGPLRLGVANVAIAGNALLPASDPGSALARLDRDVLEEADVTTVVVLLGTNDLGAGRGSGEIVDALQQVISRAHAAGVRVVGATIPPIAGPADPPEAPDPLEEQRRQEVNARVRPGGPSSLGFDAVVDFDAVLRDPANPSRIRPDLSFLGNFHPGVEGHRAMGEAVDLGALVA
jgi:lysophospholipase L1-like esterase